MKVRIVLKTEYDKRRHLQQQIDKYKLALSAAHEEISLLREELKECKKLITKK